MHANEEEKKENLLPRIEKLSYPATGTKEIGVEARYVDRDGRVYAADEKKESSVEVLGGTETSEEKGQYFAGEEVEIHIILYVLECSSRCQ